MTLADRSGPGGGSGGGPGGGPSAGRGPGHPILEASDLVREYPSGDVTIRALRGIDLTASYDITKSPVQYAGKDVVLTTVAGGSNYPDAAVITAFKNFVASTHPERSGILPTDRAVLQTLMYMITTKEIEVTQDGKQLHPDEIQSILSGAFEIAPTDVARFYYKMRR